MKKIFSLYFYIFIFLIGFSNFNINQYKVEMDENREWKYTENYEEEIYYYYNNIPYGSSMEEVQSLFSVSGRIKENNRLSFRSTLGGKTIDLNFVFSENKLYKVEHIYIQDYYSSIWYIREYEQIKEQLISFYGEPIMEEDIYTSSLWVGSKELALNNSQLIIVTRWHHENIEIGLILHKILNKIETILVHFPIANYDKIEIYKMIPIL
jgi:hypothetical protein